MDEQQGELQPAPFQVETQMGYSYPQRPSYSRSTATGDQDQAMEPIVDRSTITFSEVQYASQNLDVLQPTWTSQQAMMYPPSNVTPSTQEIGSQYPASEYHYGEAHMISSAYLPPTLRTSPKMRPPS